jgi:2-oxoglutarate ferredoxin oxidoreductase subunit beta
VDVKHLEYVLERAAKHVGTAVVEIYQNCNIFNDGAFEYATDKLTKSETTIYCEQGKPLVFGGGKKGIRIREMNPEVVDLASTPMDDLLVHNEQAQPAVPFLLSRMRQPDLPEPLGILRDVQKERYVNVVRKQNDDAIAKQGAGDIQQLLDGPETWTV